MMMMYFVKLATFLVYVCDAVRKEDTSKIVGAPDYPLSALDIQEAEPTNVEDAEREEAEGEEAEALVDVEEETAGPSPSPMPVGWKGCCFNRLAETAWLDTKATDKNMKYNKWISNPKNVLPYDGEVHSPYCCPCNDGQIRVSASKPCNTCSRGNPNHGGLKCQPRLLKDLAKKFEEKTGKNTDICTEWWSSPAGKLGFQPAKQTRDPMLPCESMCQAYSQAISSDPCTAETDPTPIDTVGADTVYDILPVAIESSHLADQEDDLIDKIESEAKSSKVRDEAEGVEVLSVEVEVQSEMVKTEDSDIIAETEAIHSVDPAGSHDSDAIADQLVHESEIQQEELVEEREELSELKHLEQSARQSSTDQGLVSDIRKAESLVSQEITADEKFLDKTEDEMEIVAHESSENLLDAEALTTQLSAVDTDIKEELEDIDDAFQRTKSAKDSEALVELQSIRTELTQEEKLLTSEIKISQTVDDAMGSSSLSKKVADAEQKMDELGQQVESLAEEASIHSENFDEIVEDHSQQDGPGLEALSDDINHDLEHSSLQVSVIETNSFDRHNLDQAVSQIHDSEVVVGGSKTSIDQQVDVLEQQSSVVSAMEVELDVALEAVDKSSDPCP